MVPCQNKSQVLRFNLYHQNLENDMTNTRKWRHRAQSTRWFGFKLPIGIDHLYTCGHVCSVFTAWLHKPAKGCHCRCRWEQCERLPLPESWSHELDLLPTAFSWVQFFGSNSLAKLLSKAQRLPSVQVFSPTRIAMGLLSPTPTSFTDQFMKCIVGSVLDRTGPW